MDHSPRVTKREQTLEIIGRFRAAKTERERRKVASSIKREFPLIAENLTKIINEGY